MGRVSSFLTAAATVALALATFTAAAPAPGLPSVAPVAPAVAVDLPPGALVTMARMEADLLKGGAWDALTATATSVETAATSVETTCQTFKEFKRQTKETVKRMKGLGFAEDQIEAFEETLLTGYRHFIVRREAGSKFCVPTEAFGEWIVDVYLMAHEGQLDD